jgi:chemosensory pili system protein ChpA (sensor histidine kinase/response regulator)
MNHHLDQEVVVGFISEAKGYLPEIMLGLESFAADATQLAALKEAFRFAHIIKGAASMLGFMQISEVAYQLEVSLEMLCDEHLPLSQELLEDLCQNVSDLADLLEQALADIPGEVTLSTDELSTNESSTNELLTDELSTAQPSIDELSLPELLPLEQSAVEPAPADAPPAFGAEVALPEFSFTPPALDPVADPAAPGDLDTYEEKGETILLPTTEAEDDLLPEARTTWASLTAPELAALETEEPLVALLNEADFSVSLPEAQETPTLGDVDLHDVAQELKESFGACLPPSQPEFALPDELMAGLPELEFATQPEPTVQTDTTPLAETSEAPSEVLSEGLPEVPEILETSAPAPATNIVYDNLADQLAENLLTESVIEPVSEEAAPASSDTQPTAAAPDSEEFSLPASVFDETLPELLPLPSLSELIAPTEVEMPLAVESVDDAPAASEPAPEPMTVPASTTSLPAPMTSPLVTDDMAEELMETFLLEAEEHLQNLHTSLRVLYKNPHNRELLQEVRRSSHSLKGTAAMVGLDNIMQLAHRMEDVLDLIYDGEMQLTSERTLLLMQATDALEDMSNGHVKPDEVQRLYTGFARLLAEHAATSETARETNVTASETTTEPTSTQCAEAEAEMDETSRSVELPGVFDQPDAPLETAPTTATAADDTLPAWPEALTESAAAEEPPVSVVPMVAELPVAPANEFAEEIAACNEPSVAATIAALPPTVVETTPAPAMTAPVVQPAAPTVHEPEVLPPASAMAQTSSQFVRVPIERLDEIVKLISEMIITRTMFEQRLTDFAHQVEELQITGTRLRRASSNLESKYEASTLGGGRPSFVPNNAPSGVAHQAAAALIAPGLMNALVTSHTHGFDDLEFDRYTEFHLVSRELVESSTDIQTLGRELNHLNSDFLSYLNRQGRVYSDLQDRLMRLRMVPLASLAPRLHRTVRTVGVQQHKEVELILEGEATALDTTALQEMTDPLLHLLRNAVDHGIEAPDVRIAKGKAALGKITLRSFYESSQVVIQLRDDGQGLNADKIRQHALEHALITPAEAETMTPQELWALIFTPGFSTAATVSEISGRGVGMDVVQTTVQKLKGTITIDSQPDAGTTFTIRLPLTLAVTRSLMVKANGQSFAIPLDVVTQIMRLEMSKVERIGQEPVVRLGGKVYPLLMLSRLLNMRQPTDEVTARPPALLLSVEGKEVVVIVDQLMGGREVVIKTLGNHLRKIHGVMGATLMGDGEVVLILNLAELLRGTVRALPRRTVINHPINHLEPTQSSNMVATSQPVSAASPQTEMIAPSPSPAKPKTFNQTMTIMVVDDSPSVRRVSSNMIKNIGWIPVQAKDGLDALEQLQASELPPDLILLDIEMPRMDGYQFLSSVRALPAYRNLPVVIVSSRSSEKHRQKAFDLGATEYLVKPYQEDNVITLIRRLVRESRQEERTSAPRP